MNFRTTDLKPRIGAQIHVDIETLLSGSVGAEIRALLQERGVIVIRGMPLTDEQQIAFTNTMGTIQDDIYKVTFDKNENPLFADYVYGTFSWHIDRTDMDIPPFSSILTPRKLVSRGGQTQFANTYAAYDDLSASEKERLDELRVVHLVEASFREAVTVPTEAQLQQWRSHPARIQPLVWKHRSGRKSLVLSTSATSVVGMPAEEGNRLLRWLMEWATQPQYVYEHAWEMGDIVAWDNTGTMHRVVPYDLESGRRLHRTTLVGEEPLGGETVPAAN